MTDVFFADKTNFNPRPRKEGDKCFLKNINVMPNFNPRPRKEGDSMAVIRYRQLGDFNPRPRKEGDRRLNAQDDKIAISIHALVKRATSA